MKGLAIVNQRTGNFDSNEYTDFYNFDLPSDSNEWINFVCETINYMIENGVQDLLFNADNYLYGVLGLIVENINRSYDISEINVYIVPEYIFAEAKENALIVENIYCKMEYTKPRLFHYQVHLTDMCNLKCKGCGHYCNLTEEHNFLDKEKYRNDILKLRSKFWGVERIQLLGGEPLLNPEVGEIVRITRDVFPDADIRVTTNGLLLPRMDDEFWQSIKDNDAHIEISLYKPTREKWGEIYKLLVEKGVANTTIVWEQKDQFFKARVLDENPNYVSAFNNCVSNKCYFLRDGKLYLCPVTYLNKIFYKEMNLTMPYEPAGIDLYDDSINGWAIEEYLKKPCEACKYCAERPVWFDWEVRSKATASIEDWVI